MIEFQFAYPLIWPKEWQRTRRGYQEVAQFSPHSLAQARDFVLRQLELLEARKPIISTNLLLRLDGKPRAGQATLDFPGVAVYFHWGGEGRVMACDKWSRVEDNLWAIGLTLEANRKQAHWGVGNLERLFQVHVPPVPPRQEAPKAEPKKEAPKPPPQSSAVHQTWWEILKVSFLANREQAKEAYLKRVKEVHPDVGGSHDEFIEVQEAWEHACRERSWAR